MNQWKGTLDMNKTSCLRISVAETVRPPPPFPPLPFPCALASLPLPASVSGCEQPATNDSASQMKSF